MRGYQEENFDWQYQNDFSHLEEETSLSASDSDMNDVH
jgi:hypothetical protein